MSYRQACYVVIGRARGINNPFVAAGEADPLGGLVKALGYGVSSAYDAGEEVLTMDEKVAHAEDYHPVVRTAPPPAPAKPKDMGVALKVGAGIVAGISLLFLLGHH